MVTRGVNKHRSGAVGVVSLSWFKLANAGKNAFIHEETCIEQVGIERIR